MSRERGYECDPRVDAYIDALPEWQGRLCRQLRDLVHAADDEIAETIKRTVQPYFVLEGNVCAPLAAKDHVNLFLYAQPPRLRRSSAEEAVGIESRHVHRFAEVLVGV